jgi:hypothetical protein
VSDELKSPDTYWDADRLDLGRVGKTPPVEKL